MTALTSEKKTVRKETMDCYRIRANDEWATICVREWHMDDDKLTGEKRRFCGEILIHSAFGSWGNSWSHCGRPFKEFLLRIEFDYLFTKFMGHGLHRHDGEKSLKNLRLDVLKSRRDGTFDREEARDLWDALFENQGELEERDVHSWVDTLCRISNDSDSRAIRGFLEEPWTRTTWSYDASAVGFWRDI